MGLNSIASIPTRHDANPVEFRSDDFPPCDGEKEEVNPGLYGKRLAESLVRGLKQHGFEPLEPVAEDWGWGIPIKNAGFKLWIGCGNYQEYPDGFLCFIEPHQPMVRRFFVLWKIDTAKQVTALPQALDHILSALPGTRDKRWWTYDERHQSAAPNGSLKLRRGQNRRRS